MKRQWTNEELIANFTISAKELDLIALTVEQEMIPVEMRARVFGAATAGYLAGIPIGGLVGGYLIDWIGLLPTLFAMGAC